MAALSDADMRRYSDEGYLAPIRVLAPHEVATCRAEVEQFFAQRVAEGANAVALRTKVHLQCSTLFDLVHHPAIVEPVRDLLGADLLCRSASVFLKEPGAPAFVAWHQDAAYWELEPPDVATAWVALTESTLENGALRVIPGSHREPLLPHGVIDDPDNMLSRGQGITAPIDPAKTAALTLDAGEMSIHDVRLAHGSDPNRSTTRRMGFAIRYVAPHVRKTGPRRDTAILVSGSDRFGNFDPEPAVAALQRSATRHERR